jgi:hypothetical protein
MASGASQTSEKGEKKVRRRSAACGINMYVLHALFKKLIFDVGLLLFARRKCDLNRV